MGVKYIILSIRRRQLLSFSGFARLKSQEERMTDHTLRVHIDGASPEELARGVEAALQTFSNAGVTAFAAAAVVFKMEGEQEDLSEEDNKLVHLWNDASRAAAAACCDGWELPKEWATLEVDFDRDAYAKIARSE
jgi:hypothetical protein